MLARFARWRGWDPVLLYLDVTAETALAGQRARGRVLDSASFARHWTRWGTQRPEIAAVQGSPYGLWARVDLVDREQARLALEGLMAPGRTEVCVAG
jgi:hypothetical protein